MSKLSGHQSVYVDSCELLEPKKEIISSFGDGAALSGSCGDLSPPSFKHSSSILSRDDSVSSKGSFSSLFPSLIRSFDASSSFNVSQSFVPRPEKTLALFDIILATLRDLHRKYSNLMPSSDVSHEVSEGGEVCGKVDARIMLLQSLRSEYQSMMEEKEAEIKRIQSTVVSAMSSKNGKEELNMMDCESYWALCREMCLVESKLERCGGKLQFQVMELDSVARISPLDQYELAIRLNDISKFKTRIKVEKNGHQVWDNTTFVLNPTVDDTIEVKFFELKTLNKPTVLLDRKVSLVNNLILAEPSIYSFWLTPVGTIKLKVIVQWNAVLDDPDLKAALNQIDNRYHETVVKDGVVIRKKATIGIPKHSINRLSVNIGSLFRLDAHERRSPRGSMDDILERVEDEELRPVGLRKGSVHRERVKAEYLPDLEPDHDHRSIALSPPFILGVNKVPLVITDSSDLTELCQEKVIVESLVYRSYQEPSGEVTAHTGTLGLDLVSLSGGSLQGGADEEQRDCACVVEGPSQGELKQADGVTALEEEDRGAQGERGGHEAVLLTTEALDVLLPGDVVVCASGHSDLGEVSGSSAADDTLGGLELVEGGMEEEGRTSTCLQRDPGADNEL